MKRKISELKDKPLNELTVKERLRVSIKFFLWNILLAIGGCFFIANVWNLVGPIGGIALYVLVAVLFAASIIFTIIGKQSIARLAFLGQIVVFFILGILYFFNYIGILEQTDSVEEMREFIAKFPSAPWVYIAIQFGQVLFLPIPTTITLLTGMLIFKPWQVVLYSMAGIIPGSIIMFMFGRYAGRAAINWAIGKSEVDKYMKMIHGRDVSLLSAMFLTPFFPDDTLCVIAGMTPMSFLLFLIVITVTRLLMCFQNYLYTVIPFSGFGLVFWIIFFGAMIYFVIYSWRHGEKIQNWLQKHFSFKENKKKKNIDKENNKIEDEQ